MDILLVPFRTMGSLWRSRMYLPFLVHVKKGLFLNYKNFCHHTDITELLYSSDLLHSSSTKLGSERPMGTLVDFDLPVMVDDNFEGNTRISPPPLSHSTILGKWFSIYAHQIANLSFSLPNIGTVHPIKGYGRRDMLNFSVFTKTKWSTNSKA